MCSSCVNAWRVCLLHFARLTVVCIPIGKQVFSEFTASTCVNARSSFDKVKQFSLIFVGFFFQFSRSFTEYVFIYRCSLLKISSISIAYSRLLIIKMHFKFILSNECSWKIYFNNTCNCFVYYFNNKKSLVKSTSQTSVLF